MRRVKKRVRSPNSLTENGKRAIIMHRQAEGLSDHGIWISLMMKRSSPCASQERAAHGLRGRLEGRRAKVASEAVR